MAPTMKEITNNGLAKIFSVEFLTLCVVIGIAWGTQAQKMANAEDEIESIKSTQMQYGRDFSEMKTDIEVTKKAVENIEKVQEQQDKKLEDIRLLLMQQYGSNGNAGN